MALLNTRIVLASRPHGEPTEANFRVEEAEVPTPGPGEILVRNLWLSLDPYMRGRMNDRKSYAAPQPLDEVMIGATVGEVLTSNHPKFTKGDVVLAGLGWQLFGVSDGKGVRKVDPSLPLSVYLGAAGMPGVTAHIGLLEFGKPKAGDTVVVSAASGAVGSVVGQLARRRGARAVGIAGGPAKCRYVEQELGFDACVDYKAADFTAALARAVPNGVDVYFDNVGGPVLDAVLGHVNAFARIPLCGVVSQYSATEPYGVKNYAALLTNRVALQGFIVSEHPALWPAALAELTDLVKRGELRYSESIAEGLASAPRAFIGMLRGENFGKQLVKLA